MKTQFLISATRTQALDSAIRAFEGKPLNDSTWIAFWDRDADALCKHLQSACGGSIAACALTCDWSYLL